MRTLLCIVFISLPLPKVSPIDCYVCHSTNDDCGENINADSLVSKGATESGCNSCTKTFSFHGTIWSTTLRGCSVSSEVYCTNILGHGSCSCTTSLCNTGSCVSYKPTILLSVLALGIGLSLG